MVNSERNYSLHKGKIKFLLLEGVHPHARQIIEAAGYTNIVEHKGALTPGELHKALEGVHFVGIRSRTQLDVAAIDAANRLTAIGVQTERGLIAPVIRDADRLTISQISDAIATITENARSASFAVSDMRGGTFTISNGGVYGSLLSTPILNFPQSGILGMHKIEKRPIALPDDTVVVRPMMYLALSYDHRIVDGEQAVTFLIRVKERLEDPERMMLDV